MKRSTRFRLLMTWVLGAALLLPLCAQVADVKPESAGFSSERLERIGQAIQRHIEAGEIAGAITIVSRRGHVVHFQAHGVQDVETKKPMDSDALFRIASMTKPIVAVALLQLIEEGKVRLDDPVSIYLPEFEQLQVAVPAAPGAPGSVGTPLAFTTVPAARRITLRDLLTHTSGIVCGALSTQELSKAPRQPTETLGAYAVRLATVPLEFQPGTQWNYSPSAGFDLLGRVIEIASGLTLDQFFQQRIFKPLGMKNTFFGPAATPARIAPIYLSKDRVLEKQPVTDPRFLPGNAYFSGAGGLTSTAEDYLRFGQMLANGGELNGQRLLAPGTVELLRSAHVPDTLPGRSPGNGYGLGVRVITDRAAAGLSLTNGSYGWGGAFGTTFWVDPKNQLVGLLMVQLPSNYARLRLDFENTVMQALLHP